MLITPSIQTIETVAERLASQVVRTPTVRYAGPPIESLTDTELFIKLELLQHAGSFKARGALNAVQSLDNKHDGVTAFSAGNHAIAVAFAANQYGVSAKVVMPKTANPFRVERCRYWGAEIIFGESINDLMDVVERLQQQEGRTLLHPFESERTIEGTATVGLELSNDIESMDVAVIPVGGGGLIAGMASAIKQLQPNCKVIGVEPSGANGMARSIESGTPINEVLPKSIADSLSAPMHLPKSFSLVQLHVDEFVQVSDDELRDSMRFMFHEMKLAVEPACAAALAAAMGPLSTELRGKRVGIIACGSNIDMTTFNSMLR